MSQIDADLADAVLAAESGCNGVVLSNHGGRQLETSRSGIEILVEVVQALKERKLWNPTTFPVFIDGGVRVRLPLSSVPADCSASERCAQGRRARRQRCRHRQAVPLCHVRLRPGGR